MRRIWKRSIALALAALGLSCAAWFWHAAKLSEAGPAATRESTPLRGAPIVAPEGDAAARTNDSLQSAIRPSPDADASLESIALREPLPPHDTAVVDILDPLLARARRGDAGAACRLANELQRCRNATRYQMDPQGMEARVAGESDPRRRDSMIQFMARVEVERDRSIRTCAGVGPAEYELAFPLQMQAAQARPELRLWTALNPALDAQMFVNDLDRWQEYRQIALPWLEAAAADGDLAAVIALARVHGDNRRPGPPVPPFRQIDDSRFVTYATLLQRYGLSVDAIQEESESARARLEPDALSAAEDRAEALYRPEIGDASSEMHRTALQRSFRAAPDAAACD